MPDRIRKSLAGSEPHTGDNTVPAFGIAAACSDDEKPAEHALASDIV
jgi:hypothetical protein